jgi:hypothetical protein
MIQGGGHIWEYVLDSRALIGLHVHDIQAEGTKSFYTGVGSV